MPNFYLSTQRRQLPTNDTPSFSRTHRYRPAPCFAIFGTRCLPSTAASRLSLIQHGRSDESRPCVGSELEGHPAAVPSHTADKLMLDTAGPSDPRWHDRYGAVARGWFDPISVLGCRGEARETLQGPAEHRAVRKTRGADANVRSLRDTCNSCLSLRRM